MIDEKLLKPYNPNNTEDRIYSLWEESGFFNPDNNKDTEEYFSMVLPPPNVTGTLHIGHAFEDSMQDILIRFNRMNGKKTLWIPGTDHAAIATQAKVEKLLSKEKIRKIELGREEFLKRVNSFAQESHNVIIQQLKKLGLSLDWSRKAFTLDEKRKLAVKTAFKQMYDDNLIYRGNRIINWDPKAQTVISDDEVIHEEKKASMYTFKYSKDFPISISSTRPETKLGDTAVAVNPEDERYKEYIGKTYTIENFCGVKLKIKIVADKEVDKDFGTGALGVTPAHSQTDAEIARRNKLETKQVINEYAKMIVGIVKDLKTKEARKEVVNWLKENNLLEKEEEIIQNISISERSGSIIEPLPKLQWFINVNKKTRNGKSLKELMLEPIRNEEIKIIPDRFEKEYYHWIENLRDWCISRQLWYGHQIPVWYKGDEMYCNINPPEEDGWIQDSDTLDTWFSSGLWTFSTLGWPGKMEPYHPTTIIMPGYEILFFWVARMILMSQYLLEEIPFKTVYLHGLVRDSKGNKISKSSGNNINPINIIQEYGADALRMALVIGVSPGNDTKLDLNKVKAYKHFANKLWNITRFILTYTEDTKYDPNFSDYEKTESKLIKERDDLIKEITKEMNEYKFYLVGEKIYHYTWSRLADVIIEESKNINTESRKQFLLDTLNKVVKILHPFMPFITEEIWSIISEDNNLLMITQWPHEQSNP
ncbi:MAG: valine--tRNA ligase [Patescibacteria group bacterium]|nr:valine--tRNA ligase [Patescibacteria group bacterium]